MMTGRVVLLISPYAAVAVGLYGFKNLWVAVFLYQLVMAVGWVLSPIRCAAGRWQGIVALAAGVGAVAVGAAGYWILPWIWRPGSTVERLASMGLGSGRYGLFWMFFIATVPILEECYWRVVVGSRARGLSAVDFWFAGYHLLVLALFLRTPVLPIALAALVVVGWAWRRSVAYFGGIAATVVMHAAVDAALLGAAFLSLAGS